MDLTQKARYVKGGNILDLPSSMTYAIVVGRDIVSIAFLVAVLNHLDILARYIHNSKLDDDTKEKISYVPGINVNLIKTKWWLLSEVYMG